MLLWNFSNRLRKDHSRTSGEDEGQLALRASAEAQAIPCRLLQLHGWHPARVDGTVSDPQDRHRDGRVALDQADEVDHLTVGVVCQRHRPNGDDAAAGERPAGRSNSRESKSE